MSGAAKDTINDHTIAGKLGQVKALYK